MKRIAKKFGVLILIFAVYILMGIILSYRRQPDVSQECRSGFHAADCYADDISCDRAYIIEDNEVALLERLRAIEHAKNRVILSTFDFRADESGKDMLAVMMKAAERGVTVQILVDGMAAFMRMDRSEYFHALAAMDNVEIKVYNRINLLMPWKTMGRLHDKYVVVDNDLYILGGRNTYDYFLGDNGYKNYDRDVLVYNTDPDNKESSVYQIEEYFKSVWELDECTSFKAWRAKKTLSAQKELKERYEIIKENYPSFVEEADYATMTFAVNKITLLSNPTHVYAKEPALFYSLVEIMKSSEGDILIHTPYIICNDWMYESLREICERNPDTVLLTNSAANNGNPFGASDYVKNKGRLVDTGLNIYEYEGGVSYHGKSIAAGDRLSIIGSFNIDLRSAYLDTETMLVIDSEGLNRQLKENMKVYEAASAKVLDKENYEVPENVTRQRMNIKKKLSVNILRIFSWLRFLA